MSSIDSSASQPTQVELDEAALRDAMVSGENVRRLLRLAGVKSIIKNMASEDASNDRARRAGDAMLTDGELPSDTSLADDDMEIVSAGDVTFNIQQPTQPLPATTSAAASPTAPAAASGLSTAAKAAIVGASLLGSGGLGAAIANYLLSQPAAAVPDLVGEVQGLGVSLESNPGDESR